MLYSRTSHKHSDYKSVKSGNSAVLVGDANAVPHATYFEY